MAELIVKIKMSESSLEGFWKDIIKEAKRSGFEMERKEVVEIDEELMLGEPAHRNIHAKTMAGIQIGNLAFQLNQVFQG